MELNMKFTNGEKAHMRFKSQAQARRWEAHQNARSKRNSLNRIEVTTPIEVHDLSEFTVDTITSSTDLTKFDHVVLSAVRLALEHGTTITLGCIIVDPNPKKSLNKNQNNLNLLGGSCV
jgi:hypothetical protein